MPKDALHQLIHSLSASEKGYYIKSKGDSHLTTLFNAVNKLEEYDRAVLEKRLSKNLEIVRYLAKYKNDTYTDIIRVMRSYRQEKESSVDMRLKVYLTDIDFLIGRGLYKHAIKLVGSAKELATKYERHMILLEIFGYEIDLYKSLYKNDRVEIIQVLMEEKKRIMSMFNDEERYKELLLLIFCIYIRNPYGTNSSQSRLKHLNELMSDELLSNKERATSFVMQFNYYSIHSLYCVLMGDRQGVYNYEKKIMDCWNAYPHMKDINFSPYTSSINNYLVMCSEFEEHTFFEHSIEKLKKEIKPNNPHEEVIVFQRLNYVELVHYYQKSDFDKLDKLVRNIQPLLKKYAKTIAAKRVSEFKIIISISLFITDRYEEAYKGFSDIIKQKNSVRIDNQYLAWLSKLMIAYERGYDNFNNLYRAAQRFFDKMSEEEVTEVHLLFLKFLYQVERSPLSETKGLFVQYQSALQDLHSDYKTLVSGLDEMLIWMEHMITKESMVDISKKKVQFKRRGNL